MKALEAIQLVVEKKAPEGWFSTLGIYGKYLGWPFKVEYYVKCPKCGKVHGDFKTMREAHAKRLCGTCDLEAIEQLKKQIAQVNDPEHKVKPMAKIVGEAIDPTEFNPFDEPPDEPKEGVPIPPEDEPNFDAKSEIQRLLLNNWVDIALRELAEITGTALGDMEIQKYDGDFDPDDRDSTTYFTVEADHTYVVFKDEDVARDYALGLVKQDLQHEPGIFSKDFLERFVDSEKLADAIGDPNENWEDDEVGNLDYEELLQKMVDEDYIEFDDPVFFKKNGEPRVETPARTKKLDQIKDEYVERNKPPPPDPWEYMRDIYGDEAGKKAIEMVGIDEDAAAQAAIDEDGWQHFVGSYDGNSYDLENGAVYFRRG